LSSLDFPSAFARPQSLRLTTMAPRWFSATRRPPCQSLSLGRWRIPVDYLSVPKALIYTRLYNSMACRLVGGIRSKFFQGQGYSFIIAAIEYYDGSLYGWHTVINAVSNLKNIRKWWMKVENLTVTLSLLFNN